MKLLILTQYFPPEVGAPQNRLFALAKHLTGLGVEVSVLTAMPNYPAMRIHPDYQGKKYVQENLGGIAVHRSSIYVSPKRSIIHRLRNYFSFVTSSALTGLSRLGNFDFLLCESPPLFLGYSAMLLARRKKAKLIFNVSDLWPESAERLGVVTNKLLLKMAYRLEARLYKRSSLVTGQTQGICADISSRFPDVRTYWLPNGADLADFDPSKAERGNWRKTNGIGDDHFIFLYAGIIGLAQGLDLILDCAAEFLSREDVWFVLVGEGPERERLKSIKDSRNLNRVLFLDGVPKKEMPAILANADASIIPLRDLPIFHGAIPSKIFECLAMKVPVLLGVDGEARKLFAERGRCALYFQPGNAAELVRAAGTIIENKVLRTELAENGRKFVTAEFDRAKIAQRFFEQLVRLNKAP